MFSVVRLTELHCCPRRIAERYESLSLDLREFGTGSTQWEVQTPVVWGRVFTGFHYGDRIDKMVKSRPEVMNDISDHQTPSYQWRTNADMGNKAIFGEIAIVLPRDQVGAAVSPPQNFRLNSLSLFVGLPEFCEDAT